MHPLKKLWNSLTPDEKVEFAKAAKTTVAALQQAVGGYRTRGKIKLTAEYAARIETASRKVGATVLRKDMCETCCKCPYTDVATPEN